MATDFTQDSVLVFLQSCGGSVKNSELLLHFRPFLREHPDYVRNREQFKKFVNSVATVTKIDGVSNVVLRKKYRGHVPGGGSGRDSPEPCPSETASSPAVSPAPPGDTDGRSALSAAGIMMAKSNQVETASTLNLSPEPAGRPGQVGNQVRGLSETPAPDQSQKEGHNRLVSVPAPGAPAVRHQDYIPAPIRGQEILQEDLVPAPIRRLDTPHQDPFPEPIRGQQVPPQDPFSRRHIVNRQDYTPGPSRRQEIPHQDPAHVPIRRLDTPHQEITPEPIRGHIVSRQDHGPETVRGQQIPHQDPNSESLRGHIVSRQDHVPDPIERWDTQNQGTISEPVKGHIVSRRDNVPVRGQQIPHQDRIVEPVRGHIVNRQDHVPGPVRGQQILHQSPFPAPNRRWDTPHPDPVPGSVRGNIISRVPEPFRGPIISFQDHNRDPLRGWEISAPNPIIQPLRGQQIPVNLEPFRGQQIPVNLEPLRGQQIPVNLEPFRGQQIPVNLEPFRGQQIPVNPEPFRGQQIPVNLEPFRGQQIPVNLEPFRGQQIPVNPEPFRGQQIPVNPEPLRGQQIPQNPEPFRGQQIPVNLEPLRGQQIPVNLEPFRGQQIPVNLEPLRGQQIPVNLEPFRGQQIPVNPEPLRGQQIPVNLEPLRGQQIPQHPEPFRGQQIPVNPEPFRGQQIPVNLEPLRGQQIPQHPEPFRGQQIPVNLEPLRGQQIAVNPEPLRGPIISFQDHNRDPLRGWEISAPNPIIQPLRGQQIPVNLEPFRGQQIPVNPEPFRGQQIPVNPEPFRGQQIPVNPEPFRGQQIPVNPEPFRGQQIAVNPEPLRGPKISFQDSDPEPLSGQGLLHQDTPPQLHQVLGRRFRHRKSYKSAVSQDEEEEEEEVPNRQGSAEGRWALNATLSGLGRAISASSPCITESPALPPSSTSSGRKVPPIYIQDSDVEVLAEFRSRREPGPVPVESVRRSLPAEAERHLQAPQSGRHPDDRPARASEPGPGQSHRVSSGICDPPSDVRFSVCNWPPSGSSSRADGPAASPKSRGALQEPERTKLRTSLHRSMGNLCDGPQPPGRLSPLYRSSDHLHDDRLHDDQQFTSRGDALHQSTGDLYDDVQSSDGSTYSTRVQHRPAAARRMSSRLRNRICRSLGTDLDQLLQEEPGGGMEAARLERLHRISSSLSLPHHLSSSSLSSCATPPRCPSPVAPMEVEGRKDIRRSLHPHNAGQSPVPLEAREHVWMVKAAAGGWPDIYTLFRDDNSLLNRQDFISGFTVLHWIAKHGDHRVLNTLCYGVERAGLSFDVNAKSTGGQTPLHIAAIHGHKSIIRLLVKKFGADVKLRDTAGKRPWQYLCDRSPEILQMLGAPPQAALAEVPGNAETGWKPPKQSRRRLRHHLSSASPSAQRPLTVAKMVKVSRSSSIAALLKHKSLHRF